MVVNKRVELFNTAFSQAQTMPKIPNVYLGMIVRTESTEEH